jgi:hypothetical protein
MLRLFDSNRTVAFVRLEENANDLRLNLVDSIGSHISTLAILDDQGLYLASSVDETCGLPLDQEGRLKISNREDHFPQLSLYDQVAALIKNGFISRNVDDSICKIHAIKAIRCLTDMDLKEAKDWYEANF